MDESLFGGPENPGANRPRRGARTTPAAPPPEGRYVRVAVERGIDRGGHWRGRDKEPPEAFTYAGDLPVGQRVEVPLGHQTAHGIVVERGGPELLQGVDPAKVRPVKGATEAALLPELVSLGRWISAYYVCPLGMALGTMLPAAVKRGVGSRLEVLLERADEAPAAPSPSPPPPDAEPPAAEPRPLTPSVARAWQAIRALPPDDFPMPAKALAARIGAKSLAPVNRLLERGLLREVRVRRVRTPGEFLGASAREEPDARPGLQLTGGQAGIVAGVASAFGGFSVHLLRGVTGSGKTEVYLRLIERVLDAGGSAIVLVPEISLTPQTAGRFLDRFRAQGVAVLHSGLSASMRNQQWSAAASGAARVVVGARSAVFAPLRHAPIAEGGLGLIVVDEEHDASYKQDQLPRYHARDVAIKRAQEAGCPVLLGSATPSLESWLNATEGRYRLWELPDRVGGGKLPRVEIVDWLLERGDPPPGPEARNPRHGAPLQAIGPTLGGALAETIEAGGQAILLLNRRGYASYVCCSSRACGWMLKCAHCDAGMVLHTRALRAARPGYAKCHHCSAENLVPETCPQSGHPVVRLGAGTQRLEDELAEKFAGPLGLLFEGAGANVLRLDSDAMRSARDYFDALERFRRGEVKILLGTQMIAKGLDFPNVRLVGVVSADTAIHLPDFRAAERTFQLVSQVAGRAGRGAFPGRVIVQTMVPLEPAIVLAANHDYVSFASRELEIRRTARLPPATRMARVVCRDEDAQQARAAAEETASHLRRTAEPDTFVSAALPCPIARIADHWRFGIDVISPDARGVQRTLARLRAAGLLKSDAHTAIDVDPVALL